MKKTSFSKTVGYKQGNKMFKKTISVLLLSVMFFSFSGFVFADDPPTTIVPNDTPRGEPLFFIGDEGDKPSESVRLKEGDRAPYDGRLFSDGAVIKLQQRLLELEYAREILKNSDQIMDKKDDLLKALENKIELLKAQVSGYQVIDEAREDEVKLLGQELKREKRKKWYMVILAIIIGGFAGGQ